MASFASACRLSTRLTARQLRQDGTTRAFRTSKASLAAQNFTMPALSPTMTEGNIASWKVKEGDSFVAGDVLLEIETDKASMDVEAQDDGIMARITQGDGTKGIQVGSRIGVIAEAGDDLSTLEIPAEDKEAPSSPKEATPKEESKLESPAKSQPSSYGKPSTKAGSRKRNSYPATPAVASLLSANGLNASTLKEIPATGPQGRVLKGDVLAYLKSISSESPESVAYNFTERSTLAEFVKKGEFPLTPKKPTPAAPTPKPLVKDLEVALPVSMKAVLEVQKRMESTLGVFLPISTFIARATDVANEGLPRPKSYQPSANELFDQVLGLQKETLVDGIRGSFSPQITALAEKTPASSSLKVSAKKLDIIDLLSGTGSFSPQKANAAKSKLGLSASVNVFSLKVPKGNEKSAMVFLERVKAVLEAEPGRLVL